MTSLSVVFNAGRPSLARDDLSVLRYSRKFPSSAGGYRNFNVFANNRSVFSYSSNFTCPLPVISPSSGGGGGRPRNFKVLGGGGHNEDGDEAANQIRRLRYLLHITSLIPYPALGVLISLQIICGSMISPERGAKAKGLKLHEKVEANGLELCEKVEAVEASVEKLLADTGTRLKSEGLDADYYIKKVAKGYKKYLAAGETLLAGRPLSSKVSRICTHDLLNGTPSGCHQESNSS